MVKSWEGPDRGDIIVIDFDPTVGSEQAGIRRALVLSPLSYNLVTGLAILLPITTKVKGYPYEVAFPSGLNTVGVVLCDHIKNLDWRTRGITFKEKAPLSVMVDVQAKLATLLP